MQREAIKFQTRSFIDGEKVYITDRSKLLCHGPKVLSGKSGTTFDATVYIFQSPGGGLFCIACHAGQEIKQTITKEQARQFYRTAAVHVNPFDDGGIPEA